MQNATKDNGGNLSASAKRMMKHIVTTYLDLLERKSFNKITIQMICEEAEINKSTFYNYFEDKYHLTKVIIHDISNKLTEELFHTFQDGRHGKCEFDLDFFYKHCQQYTGTLKKLLTIRDFELNIKQEMDNAMIAAYKKLKLDHQPLNLDMEAEIFACYTWIPFHCLCLNGEAKDAETFARNTYESFVNVLCFHVGIEPKKMIEYIKQNSAKLNR